MAVPYVQPMGVGEILDRSFQTLRHHFGTLFVTALIGTVPYVLIFSLALSPQAETAESMAAAIAIFVAALLMIPVTAVVWGALAWQIEESLAGRPVSVGAGLRNGLRVMLRLIGAGIGAYLLMVAAMVPPVVIGFAITAAAGAVLGPGTASGIVAVLAFLVPSVVVAIWFIALAMLVLPSIVSEGAGPIRALKRANKLAKGGRLRVFTTGLVAWIAVLLPAIGIPFLFGVGVEFWAPEAGGTVNVTRLYMANIASFLAGAVTTPFLVAVMMYAYHDRRARREGYDMEIPATAVSAEG